MITAGDFRKGVTIEMDGGVWTIVDFQHVKPGKGAAFVRTKLKNVMTGAVVERTFNPTDKVPARDHRDQGDAVPLQRRRLLLLHGSSTPTSRCPLTHDQVEDAIHFVKENTNVDRALLQGHAPSPLSRPNFVELEVTDTEPGFKGDTATNATKPATLETGYHPQRAAVHQHRRQDPHRYPHRRIHGARLRAASYTQSAGSNFRRHCKGGSTA